MVNTRVFLLKVFHTVICEIFAAVFIFAIFTPRSDTLKLNCHEYFLQRTLQYNSIHDHKFKTARSRFIAVTGLQNWLSYLSKASGGQINQQIWKTLCNYTFID